MPGSMYRATTGPFIHRAGVVGAAQLPVAMAAAEARGRAELRAHGLARLACLLAGLVLAVSGAQAQLAVTRWFAVNQEIPDGG